MPKYLKKAISAILVFILCTNFMFSAMASDVKDSPTSEDIQSISTILADIEELKDSVNLSFVDFSELYLGQPIPTYICKNNNLVPGCEMYPIIFDGQLILWAIKNDTTWQITTELVSETNNKLIPNTPLAILYDNSHSYLYTEEKITVAGNLSSGGSLRTPLNVNRSTLNSVIDTEAISPSIKLPHNANAPSYYGCEVSYVSQNPPSTRCWAATLACVVNYCKGTSYTANSMYNAHHSSLSGGGEDGALITEVAAILLKSYNLSYSHTSSTSVDNYILNSIQAGYPVYSKWSVSSSSAHATCICGINVLSGYIYIMDPEFGFTSATVSNGRYRYTSSYSGSSLSLTEILYGDVY